MYAQVANLMSWRAGLLMADCAEALAQDNLFPYALHARGRYHALKAASDLAQSYRVIRAQLDQIGAHRLEARVTAMDLPRKGRFRVWVDWTATLPDRSRPVVAQTVEYLRSTPQGLRGEMTECTCLRMPQPQHA